MLNLNNKAEGKICVCDINISIGCVHVLLKLNGHGTYLAGNESK